MAAEQAKTVQGKTGAAARIATCTEYLVAYERCMEDHVGIRPDPYEGEWCEEYKNAYMVCRQGGKPLPGTDKYTPSVKPKADK